MTAAAAKRSTRSNGTRPVAARALPHDDEIESGLIGAALLNADGLELLAKVDVADFYSTRHQTIAAALLEARAAGWQPDPRTIAAELAKQGLLDQVGGAGELVALQIAAPAVSSCTRYPTTIRELATRRRAILLSQELQEAANNGADPTPILDQLRHTLTPPTEHVSFENVAAALDNPEADQATVLKRSDGEHLLYAGAVNAIQSEPSAGKTTIAGLAAIQVLAYGGDVCYLDYEDMLRRLSRRLLALEAARDDLTARFHYLRPGPLTAADASSLVAAVKTLNVDLVVIDGVAEALAAQALDEESASDIAEWWRLLPRPLADTGAAVLLLDHVTKSKEGRGRWARGSGHKLAAIDGAAYVLDAAVPFSRQRPGRLTLTIAKDRPGAVGATGDVAAVVHLEPFAEGKRLLVRLEPSLFVEDDGKTKTEPIISDELRQAIIESISRLTKDGGTVSRNEILTDVRATGLSFRDKALGVCLSRLWQDAEVTRQNGPNRSHLYALPTTQPTLEEAVS